MKQKNMFKFGAILGLILPLFAMSCKTSDTGVLGNQAKVAAIAGVLRTGTQIAVSTVVASKPDTKSYFSAASLAISVALGGKDLTPDNVTQLIKSHVAALDTTGIYFPLVENGIGLALGAYKTFYEANVEKDIQPYLVTLLTSVKAGIDAGLKGDLPAPAGANPISGLTREYLTL